MKTPIIAMQAQTNSYINEDIFNICATILVVALTMIFILSFVKRIFDQRLKKKIIEEGITESLAESVLRSSSTDDGDVNLKWSLILIGLGLGLIIVHYTTPLGLHSLAILSLSIASGFFGYFIYTKKTRK
ncbi:DUF6249 domain-containing protein [Pedobacter helvus]|uniref:DUF6249 domain-containing protein n=1 Tax=Pedobacter helvus TaxID=2563444 RepID=A0ABW9JEI7_9SPHI|nr:DUF6249 domain-containing protein [Pedobacter ureilyticus]